MTNTTSNKDKEESGPCNWRSSCRLAGPGSVATPLQALEGPVSLLACFLSCSGAAGLSSRVCCWRKCSSLLSKFPNCKIMTSVYCPTSPRKFQHCSHRSPPPHFPCSFCLFPSKHSGHVTPEWPLPTVLHHLTPYWLSVWHCVKFLLVWSRQHMQIPLLGDNTKLHFILVKYP